MERERPIQTLHLQLRSRERESGYESDPGSYVEEVGYYCAIRRFMSLV